MYVYAYTYYMYQRVMSHIWSSHVAHMNVCAYIHVCIYMSICICIHIHSYENIHIYVCMYIHIYVYEHIYVYVYTCMYVCIYIYVYVYTYHTYQRVICDMHIYWCMWHEVVYTYHTYQRVILCDMTTSCHMHQYIYISHISHVSTCDIMSHASITHFGTLGLLLVKRQDLSLSSSTAISCREIGSKLTFESFYATLVSPRPLSTWRSHRST